MKVLMQMDLAEELIEEIQQVAEEVEVVQVDSDAAALAVMPEIEVVCGHISQEMFVRRQKLKWMQSWGAGVDGVLHPELVESDVVLCSAKGWVGVHLAEHAMALLLGLTRGIHTAVRHPDWDQRWPIRAASWELVEQTMGIVGLGGTGRELAQRASAFGMRIIAVDPEEVPVPEAVEACWGMDQFHALLEQSDLRAADRKDCRAVDQEACADAEPCAVDQRHAGANAGGWISAAGAPAWGSPAVADG